MSRDMWNEQWERVLWKRKPYPDNFVPDSFLASLSTNRESAAVSAARRVLTHPPANFRPYTYWSLVQASWTVSLHLAAIFTFVAVFVRLKERLLDPRLLVWTSVLSFISFYILWEIVEASRSKSQRAIDRECPSRFRAPLPLIYHRRKNRQVLDIDLPRAARLVPCSANSDRCHVFGLYMGSLRLSVLSERCPSRLHPG